MRHLPRWFVVLVAEHGSRSARVTITKTPDRSSFRINSGPHQRQAARIAGAAFAESEGLIFTDVRTAQNRIQGIRLGGKDNDGQPRTASSMEPALAGVGYRSRLKAAVPKREVWCDWESICKVCNFTRGERSVFLACRRDGRAYQSLGLSYHQTGALNRGIDKKLQLNRSEVAKYFGYLDPVENNIAKFQVTARFQSILGTYIQGEQMQIEKLRQNLQTEREKWQRIAAREGELRSAHKQAQNDVLRLEFAIKADQAASILEERTWPSPRAEKELITAKGTFAAAQAALDAAASALEQQAGVVDGIESEISARQVEIFRKELEPLQSALMRSMRDFCEAAANVNELAGRHGIWATTLGQELFPSNPKDVLEGFSEKLLRAGLINAALGLKSHLENSFSGRAV